MLLEEEIFNKLQDQLANDNNAKYVHKLLVRCREKNKDTVSVFVVLINILGFSLNLQS